MKALSEKSLRKTRSKTSKGISRVEISERLVDLDLAHTSALRDLEMDISGEKGIASKTVLKQARALLRK